MADSTDGREVGINFKSSLNPNVLDSGSESEPDSAKELFDYVLRSQGSPLGIILKPNGGVQY